MMKPLQVNSQAQSSSSRSYHSQQEKIIHDKRAKADADAESIRDYYAQGRALDEIIVQRPAELRVHLDPKKLSFDLSANVAGHEWPVTVGAGVGGGRLTQNQRKAAAYWCLAGFQGASKLTVGRQHHLHALVLTQYRSARACTDPVSNGELCAGGRPFSVHEVEHAFAERKPAAKKGKKAKGRKAAEEVGPVPENAGELALEMVQWLVRRGLLELRRLGPRAEDSTEPASGGVTTSSDRDDL